MLRYLELPSSAFNTSVTREYGLYVRASCTMSEFQEKNYRKDVEYSEAIRFSVHFELALSKSKKASNFYLQKHLKSLQKICPRTT